MHAGQSHTDYKELYEEQLTLTAALTHELTQIKKMIFGSRRERFIPAPDATKKDLQLALDLDAETIAQCRITSATKVEYVS